MSTAWGLYWNLAQQKRAWVEDMISESSRNAPNKGGVFKFEEFRKMVLEEYNQALHKVPFPTWMTDRFMAVTFLLAALRTAQHNRFRQGGLKAVTWYRENRDENHFENAEK